MINLIIRLFTLSIGRVVILDHSKPRYVRVVGVFNTMQGLCYTVACVDTGKHSTATRKELRKVF